MSSIDSLEIDLGVPVTVENDDDVGGVKIDAETASSGAQDENFFIGSLLLKIFNAGFSVVG